MSRPSRAEAWNQQTIEPGHAGLLADFTPLTDMRASAAYRMRVAQNLLQRFYLENTAPAYPVRLGVRYAPQQPGHAGESDGAGD